MMCEVEMTAQYLLQVLGYHALLSALCQVFLRVNPSTPRLSSNSPYCLLYNTSDVSSENLVLDHLSIPLLIISFILITYLLEVVLIL